MSIHSKNTNSPIEAFVYLWFDAKNRMFYLGYHKGSPDDNYTHSSSVMESFTKTTIPPYMHRRILATGTEQEMVDLEKKLLDNRKERCWDKYYNVTVSFPPPPKYGEDNPMWKGGVTFDPVEYYREYNREWREKNPEKSREYHREYMGKWRVENPEKVRESQRKWYAKRRESQREYKRKHYQENAEKLREKQRQWRAKNAEKIREYNRKYRAKKKAGNSVDLTQFMG